jgi:hypothetical protein
MRLRRESVAHFAAPTPNALTVDAMLGEDLLARVAFIVIVIDLGRLRLRSVKCRTSGHEQLPLVGDDHRPSTDRLRCVRR